MEEDEESKFTCRECGKDFEPYPDAMVAISIAKLKEEDFSPEEWAKIKAEDDFLEDDEIRAMTAEQLAPLGLTVADRDRLLNDEEIDAGGACICVECQDRMAKEQWPENGS